MTKTSLKPGYKGVVAALLALTICLFAACTQERQPCLTPKIASLNLHFVHFTADTAIASNNTQDTALPSAVFIALTSGGGSGVKYIAPSAYFTLSLSSVSDSCAWLFGADSTITDYDTLQFYYQRKLQFLSNACGYTYFYALDSVHTSHNHVDSVLITNPSVTNDVNTKQLKIYMHPLF